MRPGVLFGALFLPLAAGATPIPAAFPPSSKAMPPPAPATPAPSSSSSSSSKPDIPALLTGALPADGTADVVLIDWPGTPGTPHVRAATVVAAASPGAIKTVLLDAANYRKIVPALMRADVSRTSTGLPSV